MEYNDEQILNLNDYEKIAKAYAAALSKKGFTIAWLDSEDNTPIIDEIFARLANIKSLLFALGGFLNTGKFYSLNERQCKKLCIIFDHAIVSPSKKIPFDKTKCFLSFLSEECLLLKALISIAERSSFEAQIKEIIFSRLNFLSQILQVG